MKFAVVILACVAAASAQFNTGAYNAKPYNPFNNQYNRNQYNPFNRNYQNQYNQGQYNQGQYNYRTTQSPFRFRPVSVTTPAYTPIAFTATTPAPAPVSSAEPAVVSPSPAPVPVPVVAPAPVPIPVARIHSDDRNAQILKYGNEVNPDGSFSYFYETDNGIAAQEQGTPRDFGGNPPVVPSVAQGSFSWTSPEGVPIVITYVADENGYQPSGDAIPTAPPLPPQIARALAYTARYVAPVKK